jgi:hypothetical protein
MQDKQQEGKEVSADGGAVALFDKADKTHETKPATTATAALGERMVAATDGYKVNHPDNSLDITIKGDVPLVASAGIMIKGLPYSYKEAREVLAELKAAGYGNPQGVYQASMNKHVQVKRTVIISSLEFSHNEANDLTLQLIDELE